MFSMSEHKHSSDQFDIINQLIKKIDKLVTIIEFKSPAERFSTPTVYTPAALTKALCRNGTRCIYHIRRRCWFDHTRYPDYEQPAHSTNEAPTAAHLSSAPLQEPTINPLDTSQANLQTAGNLHHEFRQDGLQVPGENRNMETSGCTNSVPSVPGAFVFGAQSTSLWPPPNYSSLADQVPPSRSSEFFCSMAGGGSSSTLRHDNARASLSFPLKGTHLAPAEPDRPPSHMHTNAHTQDDPRQDGLRASLRRLNMDSTTNLSSLAEQEPPSRSPEFYCSIADEDSSTTLRRDDARVRFRVRP